MYIRMKTSKKAKYPTLQIVEGYREGDKVRQRTVAHLGVVKSKEDLKKLKDLADKLIQRLEQEGLEVDPKVELQKLRHEKTVYDGFGTVVEKLIALTGLDTVIQSAQGKHSFNLLSTQSRNVPSPSKVEMSPQPINPLLPSWSFVLTSLPRGGGKIQKFIRAPFLCRWMIDIGTFRSRNESSLFLSITTT